MTLFTPTQTAIAALLVFRLTGLLWAAPLFSARTIPATIKVAILGVLSILMWPAAVAAAPDGIAVTAPAVLGELIVGITLGLGAAVFVGAAESAGDMVAVQMGLSGANVLDPSSATQMPVIGQFMGMFTLAVILSVGGHIAILEALVQSLRIAPAGSPIDMSAGLETMIAIGGNLFAIGLRIAAPMVAAMLISYTALGIMARTTPQLNVLMVAFPVQIAVGLFLLAATLPMIAGFFSGFDGMYRTAVGDLLGSFTGAASVPTLQGGPR